MFQKLRRNFIILNMTMMSLAVILAFLAIYLITLNHMESQNDLKLENTSASILRQVYNSETNDLQIVVSDISSEYYRPVFSALLDEKNQPIIQSSASEETKAATLKMVDLALSSSNDKLTMDNRTYQFSITSAFAQVNMENPPDEMTPQVYRLITFLDITDSQDTLNQLLFTFLIIGFFLLGAIFLISVFFARRSVAPIEASFARQKQFVADASHELKTPVASIGANLEAIGSNPEEKVSSQKKWMDYIKIELERMNKLINDLLSLARYDNLQTPFHTASANVSDLVHDSLLAMEAFAFERGIEIHSQIQDDIVAVLDKEKYQQVITILLDNAVKYANASGTIRLLLKETKNQAVLEITNTGEGIPPESLDKIFDRFYRVDPSRENNGSYGLGLPIAKTILDQMNGKITVRSSPGQTTTFTVTINK